MNSAAVFYATNVFEGLRAYWNEADGELYCFRLDEHFARLRESMKMMRFTVPYTDDDLYEAVREVLARQRASARTSTCTWSPTWPAPGLDATTPDRALHQPAPARRASSRATGSGAASPRGRAPRDNAIPIRLKCGANYQNGRLATLQAKADGYDAPIFLNQQRHGGRGHGRDVLHGAQGQARHAAASPATSSSPSRAPP